MAIEVISTKLLSSYYGNTIYIWSGMLFSTLSGLAVGYFIGGKGAKSSSIFKLVLITLTTALFILLLPDITKSIIPRTLALSLKEGSLLSCFILIAPPMVLIGSIGPIAVDLLANYSNAPTGKIAGKAFFTSTISGAMSTFIFALFMIPNLGLQFSTQALAFTLSLTGIAYLFHQLFKVKHEIFRA